MERDEVDRADRARRRRKAMWGEIVAVGTPKPPLHREQTPEERFRSMTDLCRRQWLSSGRPLVIPGPRSTWPGEVFRLPWAP